MSDEKNYDNLLFTLLGEEVNVASFFDTIFEFLYRRTDFFKIKLDESSSLGLLEGEAENIVKDVFVKYMKQAVHEQKEEILSTEPILSDCAAETTVYTTESPEEAAVSRDIDGAGDCGDVQNSVVPETKAAKCSENKEKVKSMDSECYNGASYDSYSWSQSLTDIDVVLKVPHEVMTGKQVRVAIQQNHLKAEISSDGHWSVLKDCDLSRKIKVEESAWTLVPRDHIHVCLQKMQEVWWNSLFVDEPKIDTKAIDATMPYEDLDEEAQAKIQEMMFDQEQKLLGMPTIEQLKVQDVLKKAWDQDGSPFQGQPYDPTILDM